MTTQPPQPVYFGPDGQQLFGWLHRPAHSATSGLALVVCSPFGFEEVCAHRALRDIAEAAAASGVPTLRFDYPGSGHSSDVGDLQSDLWPAWVDAVRLSIDAVRLATGAHRVALLGVRLGALLAAFGAQGRSDVCGLILVAPVVRGRAFLRELAMLGATGTLGASAADAGVESAGFAMSAATCASMAKADLSALSLAAHLRVRVVERDDMPGSSELTGALARSGLDARSEHWAGYESMMADPQHATTPLQIVEGVTATLHEWAGQPSTPPAATAGARVTFQETLEGGPGLDWIETPVRLETGAHTSLFGVVCRPLTQSGVRPAVLLLSAGAVHAIGPNRLWVQIARRWARRGITVLRLDLSGIGDSPARAGEPANVVYSRSAMADVAVAVEWLLGHDGGATRCHVMGLCSGAYHSFKAATSGLPVATALMINPLTYFWKQGAPLGDLKEYEVIAAGERYLTGLFRRESWRRLARGELDLRQIATTAVRVVARAVTLRWRSVARAIGLPQSNDLAGELLRAADRGKTLNFVFATDAPGCTLLQQQGGSTVQRLKQQGHLALEFVDGADHTFTRSSSRDTLIQRLDRLMLDACDLLPVTGGPVQERAEK